VSDDWTRLRYAVVDVEGNGHHPPDLVANAPRFADIADDVRTALESAAIVAHNAHVDLDVLRRKLPEWEPAGVFDTLKPARRLVPGRPAYRLGALVEAFGLGAQMPPGLQPPPATYDALVTARLFTHLATQPDGSPRSLAELRDARPGGGDGRTPPLF
jgi:exodeoxyribonuclease X